MIINNLPLDGAFIIDLKKIKDERGFFSRYWCKNLFLENKLDNNISQINTSFSRKMGTLRGLHFQSPPKAETKIVRCIKGSIWDVIVDIRKNSKTYGDWYGTELNDNNRRMLYIPKGFAHGFISLQDKTEIIYLVSEFYSHEHEKALRWNDSFHKINWPMNPKVISEKDLNIPDWDHKDSI